MGSNQNVDSETVGFQESRDFQELLRICLAVGRPARQSSSECGTPHDKTPQLGNADDVDSYNSKAHIINTLGYVSTRDDESYPSLDKMLDRRSSGEWSFERGSGFKSLISRELDHLVVTRSIAYEKAVLIIKKYQESPELLTDHLPDIVASCFTAFRDSAAEIYDGKWRDRGDVEVAKREVADVSVQTSQFPLPSPKTDLKDEKQEILSENDFTSRQQIAEHAVRLWISSSLLYNLSVVTKITSLILHFPTDVAALLWAIDILERILGIQPLDRPTPAFQGSSLSTNENSAMGGDSNGANDISDILNYFEHGLLGKAIVPRCMIRLSEATPWRVCYVFLVWLSLLAMSPFELEAFAENLALRMWHISISSMRNSAVFMQPAALVIARLFARTDTPSSVMEYFVEWVKTTLQQNKHAAALPTPFEDSPLGCLSAIKVILKRTNQTHLAPHLPALAALLMPKLSAQDEDRSVEWPEVIGAATSSNSGASTVKTYVSTLGRLGVSLLPFVPGNWRIKPHRRRLLDTEANESMPSHRGTDCDFENAEITESTLRALELITDLNLQALSTQVPSFISDQTTPVRWAAAKALGRTAERLPKFYGLQLVEAVAGSLEDAALNGDSTGLPGAALAAAELIRKGCVLPETKAFKTIMRWIPFLLTYDPQDTSDQHRTAVMVRDGACFILWGAARMYSTEVLEPFSVAFYQHLIVAAALDTDINCRRAASASLQELVGRHGSLFPHGLDVIVEVDYFNVATMRGSYLRVAPSLARFPFICTWLMESLCGRVFAKRRNHREMAAAAIEMVAVRMSSSNLLAILKGHSSKLIKTDPSAETHFKNEELHGHLLLLTALVEAQTKKLDTRANGSPSKSDSNVTLYEEFGPLLQTELRNIVVKLEKARVYRGHGGESIREAVCRYIGALCRGHAWIEFKANTGPRYFTTLTEGFKHISSRVLQAAVEAFVVLVQWRAEANLVETWITSLLDILRNRRESITVRRGCILALSLAVWSKCTSETAWILFKLFAEESVAFQPLESRALRDPLTRQAALIGLCGGLQYFADLQCSNSTESIMDTFVGAVLKAAGDVQFDRRGDVGSWVREAALESICCCLMLLEFPAENSMAQNFFEHTTTAPMSESLIPSEKMAAPMIETVPFPLDPIQLHEMIGAIIWQATEKFDRTRGRASFLLYILLRSELVSDRRIRFESIYYRIFYYWAYEIGLVNTQNKVKSNATDAVDTASKKRQLLPNYLRRWLQARDALLLATESIAASNALICSSQQTKSIPASTTSNEDSRQDNAGGQVNAMDSQYSTAVPTQTGFSANKFPSGHVPYALSEAAADVMLSPVDAASPYSNLEQSHHEVEKEVINIFPGDETVEIDENSENNRDSFYRTTDSLWFGRARGWEPFDYTVGRLHKSGTTIRCPGFANSGTVIEAFIPLICQPTWWFWVGAGIISAVGSVTAACCRTAEIRLINFLRGSSITGNSVPRSDLLLAARRLSFLACAGGLTPPVFDALCEEKSEQFFETLLSLNDCKPCLISEDTANRVLGVLRPVACLRAAAVLLRHDLGDITSLSLLSDVATAAADLEDDFTLVTASIEMLGALFTVGIPVPGSTRNNLSSVPADETVRRDALACLVRSLAHKYPAIRRLSARTLYSALLPYGPNIHVVLPPTFSQAAVASPNADAPAVPCPEAEKNHHQPLIVKLWTSPWHQFDRRDPNLLNNVREIGLMMGLS